MEKINITILILILLVITLLFSYRLNNPPFYETYTIYLENGEVITLKNAYVNDGYVTNDSIFIPIKETKLIKKQSSKTDK